MGLINAGKSPVVEETRRDDRPGGRRRTVARDDGSPRRLRDSELASYASARPAAATATSTSATSSACAEDIAEVLRDKDGFTAIVIRSTVLPGTLRSTVIPTLESGSGKRAGRDFGVGFFPEVLRESTAVHDFYNPPKIVIAASDDRTRAMLEVLNEDFDPPSPAPISKSPRWSNTPTTPGTR